MFAHDNDRDNTWALRYWSFLGQATGDQNIPNNNARLELNMTFIFSCREKMRNYSFQVY